MTIVADGDARANIAKSHNTTHGVTALTSPKTFADTNKNYLQRLYINLL